MSKSLARDKLKDFLKSTAIGGQYTFDFPGNQLKAEQFVQNMRVCLSKVKKRYKVAKTPFNEFKVLIEKIETDIDIPVPNDAQSRTVKGVRVTLKREKPNNLDSVLADIEL